VLLAVGDPRLLGIKRAGHSLEDDSFLSEQIRDEARAVVVVDAEHLQHAGIREEGSGALSVGRTKLVEILQDRPELDTVTRHQPHGTFDGRQVSKRRELVE
jgi:hypothetical protein